MSAQKILSLGAVALFLLSEVALGGEAVTFAHYNIENYLEMNRREGGEAVLGPKPEGEKNTLIRIIKEIHPDILGVAEMGPPDQFEEFQKRLKELVLNSLSLNTSAARIGIGIWPCSVDSKSWSATLKKICSSI
jgi:hypothetical protein